MTLRRINFVFLIPFIILMGVLVVGLLFASHYTHQASETYQFKVTVTTRNLEASKYILTSFPESELYRILNNGVIINSTFYSPRKIETIKILYTDRRIPNKHVIKRFQDFMEK